jgi:hypothetical protein
LRWRCFPGQQWKGTDLGHRIVGNYPAGAYGEENAAGFLSDGISLLAGANNNFIRGTRQIGEVTGVLVNNTGTGNTLTSGLF